MLIAAPVASRFQPALRGGPNSGAWGASSSPVGQFIIAPAGRGAEAQESPPPIGVLASVKSREAASLLPRLWLGNQPRGPRLSVRRTRWPRSADRGPRRRERRPA